jgi:hypothetical protein
MNPLTILPPELFPPELAPLIYFTILPLIILVGGMVLVIILVLYITSPHEAKIHFWNRFKKKLILDTEMHGRAKLETATTYPDGINIGDKTNNVIAAPQPTSMQEIAEGLHDQFEAIEKDLTEKNTQAKEKLTNEQLVELIQNTQASLFNQEVKRINEYEREAIHASTTSYGAPILRVYGARAVATTLAQLAGLSYKGENKTTRLAIPILAKNKQRIEPAQLFLEKDKELKNYYMNIGLPVDPSVAKKWFPKSYNPSIINSIEENAELVGQNKQKKKDRMLLYMMIVLAAMLGLIGFLAGNLT